MTEKPHLKPSLQTQNNAWLKNSQSYLTKRQMFLDTHAKIAGKISTSFRDSHQKKKKSLKVIKSSFEGRVCIHSTYLSPGKVAKVT